MNLLSIFSRRCRAREKGRWLFMKKGLLRGLFCMALATAMVLMYVQLPKYGENSSLVVAIAEVASTTGCVLIWAYIKSGSGRFNIYTTNVYVSDWVIVFGISSGRTQVQHPCLDGYKFVWVIRTYSANAGLGAFGYVVAANAFRPNVNKAYPGVDNYHEFNSAYSHYLTSCNVQNRAMVAKGSKIGIVGNIGSASRRKHLHFAVVDTFIVEWLLQWICNLFLRV